MLVLLKLSGLLSFLDSDKKSGGLQSRRADWREDSAQGIEVVISCLKGEKADWIPYHKALCPKMDPLPSSKRLKRDDGSARKVGGGPGEPQVNKNATASKKSYTMTLNEYVQRAWKKLPRYVSVENEKGKRKVGKSKR